MDLESYIKTTERFLEVMVLVSEMLRQKKKYYKPICVDENLLSDEEAANPLSVKGEGKKNVDNLMQICPEKSAVSSESNGNMAKAINKQDETKKKNSVPLHKVAWHSQSYGKELNEGQEKAHLPMEKYFIDYSQATCNSVTTNCWDYAVFHPGFQSYGATGLPSERFVHQNF